MTDDSDDLDAPILDPADDAAITALLADLPELEMPDDVAQRVATALAGEVPLSGPAPAWAVGGATNVSVLPSQRERDQRTAARRGRVLSAAAAVVLVLGAVALGTQFFQGDGGGASETAGGGLSGTSGQAPVEATLLSSSGAAYTQADLAPKVTGLVTAASAKNAPVTSWADVATPAPASSPSASSSPVTPASDAGVSTLARTPLTALAPASPSWARWPDSTPWPSTPAPGPGAPAAPGPQPSSSCPPGTRPGSTCSW